MVHTKRHVPPTRLCVIRRARATAEGQSGGGPEMLLEGHVNAGRWAALRLA